MTIAKNLFFAYNSPVMMSLGKTSDNNIKTAWLSLNNGWTGKAALYKARGRNFSQHDWDQSLSRPNLLFEDIEKILKVSGQNCVAVKNLPIRETQLKVVIKRHYIGAGFRQFFRSFRPGRALRNFKTALNLINSGFPVVIPFAALQQRRTLQTRQSIYVTEYFPNTSDLYSFVLKRLPTKPGEQLTLKKQLSQQLASVLASLHENGLWHRDSKASNFIVCRDTHDEHKILLVDMDGIKHYWLRRRSRQFRSLWHLAASLMSIPLINRTDYWRTFSAYCDFVGLEPSHRRSLFRMLAKRAQAKRMKNMATVGINK